MANEHVERRLSELRHQSVSFIKSLVYMVHEASAAAGASRHSRLESFNDMARQNIGRSHRIPQKLQLPAPAFWPMTDSGATVNVVRDTELAGNLARILIAQGPCQ